jgi:hypothetical protein
MCLRPTIWRAVQKVQKGPFVRYLADRIRIFDTPGLPTLVHEVDFNRLSRELTRFTKALYFHHSGLRLPGGCQVYVAPEVRFDEPDIAFILERLRRRTVIDIGGGVFSYQYRIFGENEAPGVSGWLFRFYDAVPFFTFTTASGTTIQHGPAAG